MLREKASINIRIYLLCAEIYRKPKNNLFGDNSQTTAQTFFGFTPTGSNLLATSNGTHPTALAAILDTTLADNGGPTLSHALVAGSPAIDAAGDSGLATDQRGIARPQGCADDIGAFELDGVTCPPEIDVLGNGVSIASGDSTPDSADHIAFGNVMVDSNLQRTFTIQNSGNADLTDVLVTVDGSACAAGANACAIPAGDFTLVSAPDATIDAGDSSSFTIEFAPTAAGPVDAVVTIASNDSNENPYTFVVGGAGVTANAQLNGVDCLLIDAINAANSDAASGTCPAGSGADTITLLQDVMLNAVDNADYANYGANGLPQINSVITIQGGHHTISRAANAPAFRFFDVVSGGVLTLNDLTLSNGDVTPDGRWGGAIHNYGTVTIHQSTLSGNIAGSGGAIYNAGTLTVNQSTISGNVSTRNGGGILNDGTLTVRNSTISGNSAGSNGGGLFNRRTATVTNSTISANSATNKGGAIYNGWNSTLTLARSLLSGNSAADGAELYNEPEKDRIPAGIVNSNNGNLFGQNDNAGTSGFTPTASDLVPSVGLSAILASLADNSGGTQTHALVAGSPAIDAAGDSGLATDQRGITRPQGAADDIGAFELEAVPATITIVLDARPEIQTNLGFQSSFGTFILDDPAVDDSDAYTNTKSFTVAPGSYTVRRNNPAGWFTTAIACTPDGKATIDLPQRRAALTVVNGDNVTCTFTVERAVRIFARAFNDEVRAGSNLGRRNARDPWLDGQAMTLTTSPTQPLGSGVTAPVGNAKVSFINLRPGSYTVCTSFPADWMLTNPTAVDPAYGQPCKTVTLTPGQVATVLFGAYGPTVVASELFTPEEETITDEDSIVEQPYDPAEDETATDEAGARRLFLPLVAR